MSAELLRGTASAATLSARFKQIEEIRNLLKNAILIEVVAGKLPVMVVSSIRSIPLSVECKVTLVEGSILLFIYLFPIYLFI